MDELEINRLLKTVYNKKMYIALIILLFIVAGYMYSYYYVTPKYKAETTIILIKNADDSTKSEITQNDINLNQKLVATYGEIIKSNKVLRTVIRNLNLNLTESKLYDLISVTDINNTEILKITVVNENARIAKRIANEVAKVFSQEVTQLYKIDNVNIIDEAEENTTPYNINHIKDIIIFAAIGVAVSGIFVIAMYYFDSTIKEEEDVEAYIGVNLLSTIPMHQKYMKTKMSSTGSEEALEELITYEDYKSPISEFFRTLRTNIIFAEANNNSNMRTILVTSGMMGEGKSWVTANLATAFAQSNKNVLLIDSDMRKGRQHHIFKVKNNVGLSNCLAMKKEDILDVEKFKEYIQETRVENLHIMTGGNRPPNPSELLSSEKMKLIIETLKNVYDVIIFDGTPCMLVSDSIILSSMIDTSIIVAEYRKSKIENTKKLKKSIENAGGKIGGLVLNKLPISAKSYKSKYYYGDKNKDKSSTTNNETIEVQYKTVEELIDKAKKDINKTNNMNSENAVNMSIDEKINRLEAMMERYFSVNNEFMRRNIENIEELKSETIEDTQQNNKEMSESKEVEENIKIDTSNLEIKENDDNNENKPEDTEIENSKVDIIKPETTENVSKEDEEKTTKIDNNKEEVKEEKNVVKKKTSTKSKAKKDSKNKTTKKEANKKITKKETNNAKTKKDAVKKANVTKVAKKETGKKVTKVDSPNTKTPNGKVTKIKPVEKATKTVKSEEKPKVTRITKIEKNKKEEKATTKKGKTSTTTKNASTTKKTTASKKTSTAKKDNNENVLKLVVGNKNDKNEKIIISKIVKV